MNGNTITDTEINSALQKYRNEGFNLEDFDKFLEEYLECPAFRINQNVEEVGGISPEAHFIMRALVTEKIKEVFRLMKVDLTDDNVTEDLENGNIGTPGRIAKMWCSSNTKDIQEPLAGRWVKKPRMASFPNDTGRHDPVFVTTKLDAMCSHHFIRFGDDHYDDDSFVVVGYIPEKKLGGISKINRFVEWCARRGWLQESLTQYIGEEVKSAFETGSVYVALMNNKHGCASTRGACDREAATSTIYATGDFQKNPNLIPPKFRG